MVRIIAGTLLEAGRGRIEPDEVPTIIAARDRSAAGPTLPPEGLFLMWVRYPGEVEEEVANACEGWNLVIQGRVSEQAVLRWQQHRWV